MISLIPCYSLEDFSLYRKSAEVDEIFSAWSALYHPALVARFDTAPRWEPAGNPSANKTRRLIVIPPCTEYLISRSWVKSAEADGAVVIRDLADRDEILYEAFSRLGIDPASGKEINKEESQEEKTDANVRVDESAPKPKTPYNDEAETFLAAGLACLLEELLTRKLRYMSNLDQVSFNTRIVDAAKAYVSGDVQEREKNLQKAFDLLAQSKEYFFPTSTKFLDLTRVVREDFEEALPNMLRSRRLRNEKTNLVLPVSELKYCQKERPETFKLLQEEVEAKRTTIIGGDEWEAPLYLQAPLDIARELIDGRNEYLKAFGVAPEIFGRCEAGYAQILPQLLKLSGYRGALATTGDGWTLNEKPGDRSKFRWQGRDGSIVPTLCKKSLDASSSEELLQLPERVGSSYYSDDASAVVFEHRPNQESRWLRDLMRMDRYAPILGKFHDINDYFHVTESSGDKTKFVKDQFKTNFLTRSIKRGNKDVVSLWTRRARLCQIVPALDSLETTLRIATLKTKRTDAFKSAFAEFLGRIAALKEKTKETLRRFDERVLPVEIDDEAKNLDALDEALARLEEEKQRLLEIAAQTLARPEKSEKQGLDDEKTRDACGFLVVNSGATPKELLWETRAVKGASADAQDEVNARLQEAFEQAKASGVRIRTFAAPSTDVKQYATKTPPCSSLWIPKDDNLEYRFLNDALFDASAPSVPLWEEESVDSQAQARRVEEKEAASRRAAKNSFFKKLASKFKSDDDAQAANGDEDERSTLLAEYVVRRYSASEIERYYRLKNDYFELRIDPTSGAVKRLVSLNSTATFSNGVLRQPTLGNRLAWDVAFKLNDELQKEDRRPKDDSSYGYSTSAADKIDVLASEPGVGKIRIEGRAMAPNGECAATFAHTIAVRRKSKIIEVELEIRPNYRPDRRPWDSYYACRFAWKDALADLRGGVGAALIGTARDYLQAPESVDVRSEDSVGITILSSGLPYFKKTGDARLDAVLIPWGETKRRFRFGIGIDLEDPHSEALSFASPSPFVLENVPCPKRVVSSFFSVEASNVQLAEIVPLVENESFVGVRATLLETHSAKTKTTIKSFLPVEEIEELDFTGKTLGEKRAPSNANLLEIELNPRQIRILNVKFKASSLR